MTLLLDGIDIEVADDAGTTQSPLDPRLVQSVPALPWGLPLPLSHEMSDEPGLSDVH